MGNYSSCFKLQDVNSKMLAKLGDSQGQLRPIKLPTTAAELMLENPGFAIAPVDKLLQTRRVSVMKADDELHGRKVYMLVPVDKVNSRLSELQLDVIESISCSRKKLARRARGRSKVTPFVEDGSSDGETLDDLVKSLSEKCSELACQKNRLSKVWEPVLEPILEVC